MVCLPVVSPSDILVPLADFNLANKAETYALDGAQQPFAFLISSQRISNLGVYLKNTFPVPSRAMMSFAVVGTIASIFQILVLSPCKILASHLAQSGGKIRRCVLLNTARFLNIANKLLTAAETVIVPMTHIAAIASYVAMIVFGHPIAGGIGLACLALIVIKQAQLLPAKLDTLLDVTSYLAGIFVALSPQTHIILRITSLVSVVLQFLNYVSRYKIFQSCLHRIIKDPLPPQRDPNAITLESWDKKESVRLQLNPASFFAKEVPQIIPLDCQKDLSEISIDTLYEQIEKRIKGEFQFTDEEKAGWKKLKTGVCSGGRTSDQAPANIDQLIYYLKAILFHHSKDSVGSENFEKTMRDLARAGNQCNAGWSRDISFLLNPSSKDYKWTIHHLHAIFRGELIKEVTRELVKYIDPKILDGIGGANNVHISNQIQAVLECRWHTYEAKVFFSIHGRSLFYQFLRKIIPTTFSTPFLASPQIRHNITDILLMLAIADVPFPLYGPIDVVAREAYQPENLVNMIYEKVKPQYRQSLQNSEHRAEVFREIEWEPIATWVSEASQKGVPILNDDGTYNETIVKTDKVGNHYLTKIGVELLLWDLDILANYPLKCSPKPNVAKPFNSASLYISGQNLSTPKHRIA